MSGTTYDEYIARKSATTRFDGIAVDELAPHLYPFQSDLTRWALRRGRAAIFADTGLGKTLMQVEWARIVAERGRVLILAPLAVAEQTSRKAAEFGVSIPYRRADTGDAITITNYELLEHFNPGDFTGVVLDESSILKAYTGATRTAIIEAFRDTPFRLACTATPAPNDFTELGNHSEFLGIKTRTEMLAEYFCHDGGSTRDWRIKGHAEESFWRWVCSWGAMVKKPSDLGYDNGGVRLPPLTLREHVVRVPDEHYAGEGLLFAPTARTLDAQRSSRRATLEARVEMAAKLSRGADPVLVWCELNAEADAAETEIVGAVQVKGSDDLETKVDRLLGFAEGRYRVLVTKPSIASQGMNWQHCTKVVFMGASHSYEQTYQAIRRCWRFGQERPVTVDIVRAENEDAVVANYRRKEAEAERMSERMVEHMRATMREEISSAHKEWNDYEPAQDMEIPKWLEAA